MFVPDSDLFLDFLACWAAVGVVGVVLLTGWLTRTTAVVWVSVFLGCLAALVLGVWMAYRLDTSRHWDFEERVALRLVGGAGGLLLVLAVWALVKLRRRDAAMRPAVEAPASPVEPPTKTYDRDWLLSLLQERAGSAKERKERVATPSPLPPDHAKGTPAAKNGKPLS